MFKQQKCAFMLSTTWGHQITPDGLLPKCMKVKARKHAPAPTAQWLFNTDSKLMNNMIIILVSLHKCLEKNTSKLRMQGQNSAFNGRQKWIFNYAYIVVQLCLLGI